MRYIQVISTKSKKKITKKNNFCSNFSKFSSDTLLITEFRIENCFFPVFFPQIQAKSWTKLLENFQSIFYKKFQF